MVYDREQLYVTWGGRIGSNAASAEVWQCGMHMALTTNAFVPPEPDDTAMLNLWNLFRAYHMDASQAIYPGCMLLWVKVARLNEAGDYVDDAYFYEGTPQAGGFDGSQSGATPQDSVVITLWSGETLGRANYGRYYLPWNAMVIDAGTGAMATAATLAMANDAKQLVQDLNTWGQALPGTYKPIVSNMSRVGSGLTKPVEYIRVGSIKDTQRRRRNRLNEAYSEVEVT